jgi:hypothetical protein
VAAAAAMAAPDLDVAFMNIPPNGVNKDATALGRMHGPKNLHHSIATFEIGFGYSADQDSFIEKPQVHTRDPFEIANEDAKPMIASVRTWDRRAVSSCGVPAARRAAPEHCPALGPLSFHLEILPSGHTFVLLPAATGRHRLETILLPPAKLS